MVRLTKQQASRLGAEMSRFVAGISGPSQDVKMSVYPSYLAEMGFEGAVAFTFSHPGVKEDRSDWSMLSDNILPDGTSHAG